MTEQYNYQENLNKKIDKGLASESHTIFGWFIRNFRVTYLIIALIFIVGLWSMLTLPRESEPEVEVPYAAVTTVYLGASPTDVEELVTNKLEDKIKNLDDLNRFTSSSSLGLSSVFVEFEAEADLQESFRKLREAVDSAESELPSEAETPMVSEIRLSDYAIVTYSLIGDYEDVELKQYADLVKAEFESVSDVSRVEVTGEREREYQVIVDQSRLANFNISTGQIVNAIVSADFNLPAGNISIDGFNYGIRVQGKINEAVELNNIVVATFDGSPVFLNDLAEIKDGFKKKTTESRIGFKGENPSRAVSLMIYKKAGGNILRMTEAAEQKVEELRSQLPEDLRIYKTNDNSVFIKKDLKTLGTSAIQTFILITIILMVIISFRGALITALSVPIAFLMSFMFLKWQGMTLNSMVLFSLVLSLGLMVDNAIVIIEGINEYFEKHGKTIKQAAILSVWNFKKAITSGTLTTVSAFLPMLLVSGIMGEYLSVMPKTLTVTLLSSLFVALVIMPTIISRFIKTKPGGRHVNRVKQRHQIINGWMQILYKRYESFMANVLPSKKKRRTILATAWLLFVLAIATPMVGLMKIEMFPTIDFDYFTIKIELPVGSTLDKTDHVASQVEAVIEDIPELESYVTNIGSTASGMGFNGGGSSSEHQANITVNLVDEKTRDRKSFEISEALRDQLAVISGGEVTIEELQAGPPSGSPIEVRIFGNQTDEVAVITKDVKDYLANVDGVINIKDSMEDSTGEFTFTIDRQKADFYGLSTASIASTLRTAVYGNQASEVNIGDQDVDITVKYADNSLQDVADLKNVLLFTPSGQTISLGQVAELNFEPALRSIDHRDGEQIVTITADTEAGVNLQKIIKDFEGYIEVIGLPQGISVGVGGETEEIQKSFTEMFTSMVVAIILIAFILVLQFNSFKQPFIILFALPLSLVGVIIGLNLLRQPFSITAFVGVLSLAGIVVNDAIVLVDKINKNIKYGMDFTQAIINGGVARMQPIFLTSLTTIAGIIPLLYADAMWRGLSLTIIFGLLFSTILNLVIVPVFYAGWCRKDVIKIKNNN